MSKQKIGKDNRNFITQTLLVKCPECKKFIDLGSKSLDVYNSAFAFMLNKKCPYCEILIAETDTNESDYRVLEFI